MSDKHAIRELAVFSQFALAAQLPLTTDCIEKRESPEPDLLYHSPEGCRIAFELVELIDEDYGRVRAITSKTRTAQERYYEQLSIEDRTLFDRKYGDASLYFYFFKELTFNRRNASLEVVFDRLLSLQDGFVGDAFEDDPALAGIIECVSISRGSFRGPVFDPDNFLWVGDPTVPTIEQKFSRTYQTPHPTELLAYIDMNPMYPDDVWIPNLSSYLDSQSRPWPFRRVWVFDLRSDLILFQQNEGPARASPA